MYLKINIFFIIESIRMGEDDAINHQIRGGKQEWCLDSRLDIN